MNIFLKTFLCSVIGLQLVFSSLVFATDPKPKWCSGVKIAAFPGGPQGGVFANNVYNGFRQAEMDLGPEVRYYFSNCRCSDLIHYPSF